MDVNFNASNVKNPNKFSKMLQKQIRILSSIVKAETYTFSSKPVAGLFVLVVSR